MHVGHVVATFPPYWGGTGNVAYHNALELARRGHRVEVVTAAVPLDGHHDPAELTVHRLPAPLRFGNAPLTPGLLRLIPGFQIVHLHWPFIFGADLTLLTGLLGRVPLVVTYHHDLRADIRWQFGPYQAIVGPLVLRGAARVLAVSRDHFEASPMRRFVPDSRLSELPNGVEVARFTPAVDGRAVRARLGIPAEAVVVGYLGAMDAAHSFKGVPVLLEALARVEAPAVRLLAVGGGDLQPEYSRQAARLGLRADWTGRVSGQQLPAHVAAMDALVLPSLGFGAESFGIVLIEAMASGKPVIATALPGVRQVVDDGVNGLLVPPGDTAALAAAIERLAVDPALRARLGAAGRGKVERQYDWRQLAARLEGEYAHVLAGPGR